MVAPSEGEACRYHEREEGYEAGDADGELVCALPAHLQKAAEIGWPSAAVLEACGGEFVSRAREARVVRFGERVFAEGNATTVVATIMGLLPQH